MAGEHEGHHLVAQLAIGHLLAGVGVAHLEQHREQVVRPRRPRLAARADESVDEPVEHTHRVGVLAVARGRDPLGRRQERVELLGREAQDDLERVPRLLRFGFDVRRKQRAPDDL